MREDLGSWPPAQAEAVADVLRRAGLHPRREPHGDLRAVTVPAGESDAATREMASRMDEIAEAVRADRRATSTRRERGRHDVPDDPGGHGRRLVTERLLAAGPLLAVVVSVLFVVALVPAPVRIPAGVVLLVAITAAARFGRRRPR